MTRHLYVNWTVLILMASIKTHHILVYVIIQYKDNFTLLYNLFKDFEE